jgi:hypothetical protein
MLIRKAVVIGVITLLIGLSISTMASSKEFVLGALRLRKILRSQQMIKNENLIVITKSIMEINGKSKSGGMDVASGEMKKIEDGLVLPDKGGELDLENSEMHKINGSFVNNSNDTMPAFGGEGNLANGEMQEANGSFVGNNDTNDTIIAPASGGSGENLENAGSQRVNGSIISPSPTSNGCIATGGQECVVPPFPNIILKIIYQKIINRWKGSTSPTVNYDPSEYPVKIAGVKIL